MKTDWNLEQKEKEQIIRMDEKTWRIEDTGVRFFLLAGSEKALLIDSGMRIHHARDIAASLTDLPTELLNTHADMDHIGSNGQFASFYMHAGETENWRRSGIGGKMIPVADGDVIDIGARELRIIHLPGHTAGSIAVLDVRNRVLISGDPVQQNGRIFMFGAHRNFHEYIRSLEKLDGMKDQFDAVWPSHGDLPVSPDIIGKLLHGAERIEKNEMEGTEEEFHGQKIMAYDLGFTVLLCDRK